MDEYPFRVLDPDAYPETPPAPAARPHYRVIERRLLAVLLAAASLAPALIAAFLIAWCLARLDWQHPAIAGLAAGAALFIVAWAALAELARR